jgi:DNA-binding response OmpR family regulator
MKKKIIVAEDDNDTLTLLVTALQDSGYDVIGLPSGDLIMEGHCHLPDLFILDKEMEFNDGVAVGKYLKSHPQSGQVPLMMVSGFTDEKEAKEAGFDLFLAKPFQINTLLEGVEMLLGKSA